MLCGPCLDKDDCDLHENVLRLGDVTNTVYAYPHGTSPCPSCSVPLLYLLHLVFWCSSSNAGAVDLPLVLVHMPCLNLLYTSTCYTEPRWIKSWLHVFVYAMMGTN